MTKKELMDKYDVIVDNIEAAQVCVEHIMELDDVIIEATEKTCDFYSEGILRDNAHALVRYQPRLLTMSILILSNVKQLLSLLDDAVNIAFDIRDEIKACEHSQDSIDKK